jgi:uncharacterized protein
LPSSAADTRPEATDTKGVVELETEGWVGGSVRIAEDIASIVDDGATRRVLPVVGKSAQQNLTDLAKLRGIDMAILPADVLDTARQQGQAPGAEGPLTYVTRLGNRELHILARPEIKSVSDLANQKVNLDVRGSATATTAAKLFDLLNVKITPTNDNQAIALEKLRKGEIAAVALVAGKPASVFQSIGQNEGLHFLPVPLETAVINAYEPTALESSDYPNLVAQGQHVDTIAVGTVLVVANLQPGSARYRNAADFVEAFFTGFPALLEPGHDPKWHDINLAAMVPGWTRFPPAQRWLDQNASPAAKVSQTDLQSQFSRFIETRQKALGGPAMSSQQKQELFQQFEHWQAGQAR